MKLLLSIPLLCASLVLANICHAEVNMPTLFADGMVLQQQQAVPIWGWAPANAQVTVSFDHQSKSTTVAADGKWMLQLDPLPASAIAGQMVVTVGDESKTIRDVLVGEVWLCSGQSNMQYQMGQLAKAPRETKYQPVADYIQNEIETAQDPLLRQFEVSAGASAEKQNNCRGAWRKSVSGSTHAFSGAAYFFGRELRREFNVPVGLIKSSVGGTRIEAWTPADVFAGHPEMLAYYEEAMAEHQARLDAYDSAQAEADHQLALKKWRENGKKGRAPKKADPSWESRNTPAFLFNSKINPVIPYAIKGAIWYQGENNSGNNRRTKQYAQSLETLIVSWRELWGQGAFPFYYAQLANFKAPEANPSNGSGWVWVQDQQRRALEVNNTGMAVLHDVGEAKDIHPHNKVDVGKRLALWTLAKDYGKDLVYSGPLYKSHTIEGNKFIITFDQVGSGLMVGRKGLLEDAVAVEEDLRHFQIRGADGQWKWATAKIVSKDQVEVFHPDVEKPTVVCYAWSGNPEGANLYNKEGLPAATFTTELFY